MCNDSEDCSINGCLVERDHLPDFQSTAESIAPYRWSAEDDPTGQKTRHFIEDFVEGAGKGYKLGVSSGGRDMMSIIISLIEGKLSGEKMCIDKCLVKDIDHHMGRSSAFSELLVILQRDLNMLEHKE